MRLLQVFILIPVASCSEKAADVMTSQVEMMDILHRLEQNTTLREDSLPYWSRDKFEFSCLSLAWWEGFRVHFHEEVQFLPPSHSSSDYGKQGNVNVTVFAKRQVLRRVRNLQETMVTAGSEKSTVTIESTTTGWTVGAQLMAGHLQPVGLLFAQTGLTISASYSSHVTTGTQYSVTERNGFSCPPGYDCRSEAWTSYVKLAGPCIDRHEVTCNSQSLSPCDFTTADQWRDKVNSMWHCQQISSWREKNCNPVRHCEVVTPIMDADGKPVVTEVFLSEPIPDFHPRPRISEYKAGFYLLGSENYLYDPSRQRDKYWKKDIGWHENRAHPNLDAEVAAFPHKAPDVLKFRDGCYKLKSLEWYCPTEDEGEAFIGMDGILDVNKSPYGKTARLTPTTEAMIDCLESEAEKILLGGYDKVTALEVVDEYLRLHDKMQGKNETLLLLWRPVTSRQYGLVGLLINSTKVDVNGRDVKGRTALSWAAGGGGGGSDEVVMQLLGSPKVSLTVADKQGRTPLFWAAAKGRLESVKMLLMAEAKPNKVDKRGRTPLMAAAINGHKKVVALLLRLKTVKVHVKDRQGRTALSWAKAKGHADVVKLLGPSRRRRKPAAAAAAAAPGGESLPVGGEA
ncbi:hypothetical protein L249_3655 [Ophiocordyceps polyrhachis-furcata BCC 54312]|uniref:Uncharacterized protein n=1 Tax=Ophiocordyceps polyrhachis-furcata BCC 54312 TaxID=1330021 RepID=A0A367L4V7_9HYPO|nr:hypothetical protein L249_3655 [Ophiocordyceps polyrhachis-furcata BCC 54312]